MAYSSGRSVQHGRNDYMDFTGERAIEGKTPEGIMLSHILRYGFAALYCANKEVLDISCGTGYGSMILLQKGHARSVQGRDIFPEAIAYAQEHYSAEGLTFEVGDIMSLGDIRESFDLIVCFETIEHVADPRAALEQLAQSLRPGGILIISTPNRLLSSPGVKSWEQPWNRFHVHEFSWPEFAYLLKRRFEIKVLFGQCNFPVRWLTPFLAKRIRQSIEEDFITDKCRIRRVRPYEEAFYLIPVCELKRPSLALIFKKRIKRLLSLKLFNRLDNG